MGAFDYGSLPLGHEEIRIFELLPAADHSDAVVARIFRAHLQGLPSFSALSYCWGDKHNRGPVEIAIGSDTLSITASLETALRALRKADRPVLLWIDQICINQNDAKEKSRQIPLMKDIYSLSDETIGWLGESTRESDVAMDYLGDIGTHAHALGLAALNTATVQVLISDECDLSSGILSTDPLVAQTREAVDDLILKQGSFLEHPALDGMIQLAMLPYFKRGWIQQEIAIPPTLKFQWGSKTLDPDRFAAGVWFHHIWTTRSILATAKSPAFRDPSVRELLKRVTAPNTKFTSYVISSLATRQWYQTPTSRSKLTMASLLRRLRITQFTDPRDRIYGILGIATDKTPPDFVVDTTRRWEDVFVDAMRHIIMSADEESGDPGDGINALSLVAFPKTNGASLPSWVPDLTSLGPESSLAWHTTILSSAPYHAGGPFIRHGLRSSDPRVLPCRGIVVDRITKVGPAWEADPTTGERSHAAGLVPLSAMSELAAESKFIVISDPDSKHPFRNDPERLSEAEWRVPVLNREFVANMSASRRATTRSKTGHEMVKRYRASSEFGTYRVLLDAFRDRRSFLGAKGFVGVGPLGMQVGDLVCILYGASFPYILRESKGASGRQQLVGEAYCDGVMDGEALGMGLAEVAFLLE
ncbi:heterokaryon incompatibility protein-domain-containing protein [Cercophora newfieldiana]|uniref:Heterokaryon incompatibility protein-domain-containing protein n=1 Tax=Cercophora newfieldiana TaxID=92897 RepID=A0AA39YGN2_9PEZI|nr:heterokaryon incompatibility protein-domain-containing protein [Cercophora newfieldiana]